MGAAVTSDVHCRRGEWLNVSGNRSLMLRPSAVHDAKWRRVDLQDVFREPAATRLWFHLLADGELIDNDQHDNHVTPVSVDDDKNAGRSAVPLGDGGDSVHASGAPNGAHTASVAESPSACRPSHLPHAGDHSVTERSSLRIHQRHRPRFASRTCSRCKDGNNDQNGDRPTRNKDICRKCFFFASCSSVLSPATPDSTPVRTSAQIIDSWAWSDQPGPARIREYLEKLCRESEATARESARSTLWSRRLRQQLLIAERFFLAQSCVTACTFGTKSSPHGCFGDATQPAGLMRSNGASAPGVANSCLFKQISTESQNVSSVSAERALVVNEVEQSPTEALARVGSKAALGFAFAFLKRAWRCGEDGDVCSDLLRDALHALQMLSPATLFRHENSVWLEVVAVSQKFLRSVVLGELNIPVPEADRQLALQLLFELVLQQGTLTQVLSAVQLLWTLWCRADNRMPSQMAAPLLPVLDRFQQISNNIQWPADDDAAAGGWVSINPNRAILEFLVLPNSAELSSAELLSEDYEGFGCVTAKVDDTPIDLKQCAMILMAFLDKMAIPHLPASPKNTFCGASTASSAVRARPLQDVFYWGSRRLCSTMAETTRPVLLSSRDLFLQFNLSDVVCCDTYLLLLSEDGKIYRQDFNAMFLYPHQLMTIKEKICQLAVTSSEVFAVSDKRQLYRWSLNDASDKRQVTGIPNSVLWLNAWSEFVLVLCDPSLPQLNNSSLSDPKAGGTQRLFFLKSPEENPTEMRSPGSQIGGASTRLKKVVIGNGVNLALTQHGGLYVWGADQPFPELSCLHKYVRDIFAGHGRCIALHRDGSLYLWANGSCLSPLRLDAAALLGGGSRQALHVILGPTRCLFAADDCTYWLWDFQRSHTDRLDSLDGLSFGGAYLGLESAMVWTERVEPSEARPLPFVLDISLSSAEHLDRLLTSVSSGQNDCGDGSPMSQDREAMSVAVLHLLTLQLYTQYTHDINVPGLEPGKSKVLSSLKQRILFLAGVNSCVQHESVRLAAQQCLALCWRQLLPSADERARTLSLLLLPQRTATSSSVFLCGLLMESLMCDGVLESYTYREMMLHHQEQQTQYLQETRQQQETEGEGCYNDLQQQHVGGGGTVASFDNCANNIFGSALKTGGGSTQALLNTAATSAGGIGITGTCVANLVGSSSAFTGGESSCCTGCAASFTAVDGVNGVGSFLNDDDEAPFGEHQFTESMPQFDVQHKPSRFPPLMHLVHQLLRTLTVNTLHQLEEPFSDMTSQNVHQQRYQHPSPSLQWPFGQGLQTELDMSLKVEGFTLYLWRSLDKIVSHLHIADLGTIL